MAGGAAHSQDRTGEVQAGQNMKRSTASAPTFNRGKYQRKEMQGRETCSHILVSTVDNQAGEPGECVCL
jgi:hypothetical protein